MNGDSNGQSVASRPAGPQLPGMFARYKGWVEQELSRAVPSRQDSELYTLLRYHLGWADRSGEPAPTPASQGKALRPTLCLFACEALTGSPRRAVAAAAALELIHNFSLIHDDIQDQDLERRHQATVWHVWGVPRALVSGNALQTVGDLAMLQSQQQDVSGETVLRVSRLLTESSLEMIQGQCLDLVFEARTDITTGDYLQMIAGKTGALLRCGLEIGALLATENPETAGAFARFGVGLGRAFQIRDDHLGIWGDEATTGKATGNDIRRKKKSFPVVYALEHASGAARETLLRIYAQDSLAEADVARVLAVLDEVGAPEYSQQLTEESARQAIHALEGVALPAWARQEVEDLVDFLAWRQY